ncbi:Rrf2 family transcriptional regulator [Citrifermentans bremense]|uniref:Rrf2 family transcriptional regulator n=1 Tax=Citrifermentans bremense TaxID=60035 RepID=UPI00040B3AA6|nr:Rrf2 family transcriptional regulator [Citrifermentans bremense]
MKLNKASLFALISVLELARDPERQLSTSDIADKYGISSHHLAKVMRNLVHQGVVQAMRGVGGGYRFAGNVNRTTLLDIIQLFETLESELDLPHWNKAAEPVVSELHSVTSEIDTVTRAILDTVTLATVLKNTRATGEGAAEESPPGRAAKTAAG